MDETKKTSVMKTNLKFKPKAGYVYVVTNECLKFVKAKGVFRGKMVKPVKIQGSNVYPYNFDEFLEILGLDPL